MSINLERPNIIVPVVDAESFRAATSCPADSAWDCIELRLDLFQPAPADLALPVLLTPRHPDEGGAARCIDPEHRAELCRPWLPFASAIDIEIDQARAMAELLTETRTAGLVTVLSYHDFAATPETPELEERIRTGIERGADIVKIAARTETVADVDRLLGVFQSFPDQPLAIMGMGPQGKNSRLAAARLGSVLNYAAVDKPTVEGQWEASEFARRLAAGPY